MTAPLEVHPANPDYISIAGSWPAHLALMERGFDSPRAHLAGL